MGVSGSIRKARQTLRERLDTLGERGLTLGALLEVARELHTESDEEDDATLQVETFGHTDTTATVEIVLRWARADELDAAPCRLRVRFDVPAGPQVREVLVRSRDYPHDAAFLTAVLDATELDRDATASHVRVEVEQAA